MASPKKETKTRQLTVCNRILMRQGGYAAYFPTISLTGKWLQKNGFRSGQTVDVACQRGKLVITVAKKQRYKYG